MAEAAVRGGEASSHPPFSQRAPLPGGGQQGPTGRWAATQQEEGHLLRPSDSELPPAGPGSSCSRVQISRVTRPWNPVQNL